MKGRRCHVPAALIQRLRAQTTLSSPRQNHFDRFRMGGREKKKKTWSHVFNMRVNSRISFSWVAEKCTHIHIISRRPARIQIQWHLDFAYRTGHRLAFGLRMKHICNIILRRVVDLLQTVLECCGLVGGPRALHTSHFGNYHDKSWRGLTVWRTASTLQRNACQLENCLSREMFNMLNRLKDSYSICSMDLCENRVLTNDCWSCIFSS